MNRMTGRMWHGVWVSHFAMAAMALLMAVREAQAATGLAANVPEAAGYTLVYEFPIPVTSPGWYANPVPYTVDNSASIKTGSFDRIAYYMELVKTTGPTQWVFVSTTAFTTNAARLGVPRNYFLRYGLYDTAAPSNATIRSNVSGITNTNGCNTINLEFWPNNYGPLNTHGVPGASVTAYDFGDEITGTTPAGGHGSLQIHNYGAGQTLFAYNNWGGGGTAALGIGNQPTANPDWTFDTANVSTFSIRTLQVLVRPSLSVNNLPATNVTDTAGWMNAQVVVTEACDVWAYWGDTDRNTNSTLWAHGEIVGNYSNGVFNITRQVTGLAGGATNWYTFLASNSVQMAWATPSASFATATAPAINTGAGASVSAGQAVLRGSLSAGNVADIYIYWGMTDGGQTTNYEHMVKLPEVQQGAFSTTVAGTSGFTYHYICLASNAAGMAWSPASTNFTLPRFERSGYSYSVGLRGSIFQPVTFAQTGIDLSGASYASSLTRVFTGTKVNTVLSMSEVPTKNIVFLGPANSWNEFGGSPGDTFVATLSGRFYPTVSGSYSFRWSQDDRGWLFIDTGDDGVFDSGDAVGTYAWDGSGSRTLTAGQGYNFMFFSQDNTGGETLGFWYTPPGGSELVVNPTSPAQVGQWRYESSKLPTASIDVVPLTSGSVSATAATLTGDLYGKGLSFNVYAYWGRTDGQNVPANWETNAFVGRFDDLDGLVSLTVNGLSSDALYHYTFFITNELMTAWAAASDTFATGGVTIEASDASASEVGPDTGSFRVTRPAASTNGALTVNYTLSGTAVNGSDFATLTGSVVIPDGATSAEFTVTPLDDTVWQEGSETVVATLAPGSYLIGASSSATVTIQDGDPSPSEWALRMPLQFTGYNRAETLTNFPVLVTLDTTLSGFSYSQFLSGANGDLRFTDGTMTRELAYEIESWDPNGQSRVWVQVPAFTNNATIWMLWRKAGLTAPAYTTSGATWSEGFTVVAHQSESAGAVLDSTAYRNNGTVSGNPVQAVSGVVAGCDQFDGLDDGIAFGTVGRPINSFTFSAWIKTSQGHEIDAESTSSTTGTAGQKYAFEPELIANEGGAGMSIGTNGVSVYEHSSSYMPPLAVYSASIGSDWNYVSVTYSNKLPRIYVNGTLARTGQTSTRPVVFSPYRIGLQSNGYGNLLGSMDETRISSVPRSANWIWAEYMTAASNSVLATYGGVQSAGYPEIANRPASGVSATAATLNGSLSATGMADTAVAVYWGTQDGGNDTGAWANTNWFASPAAPSIFSKNIMGLSSGTTYFYRYLATNAYGVVWAPTTETLLTAAVTLQATDASAAEQPTDTGTITVSRGTAYDAPLTVYYTLSGTGVSGVDFSALSGSVTIPAGAATADIAVTPLFNRNYLVRATDTVTLTLSAGGYLAGGQNSGTVTITNWQPSSAVQRDVPRNFIATSVDPLAGSETLAKTSAGQLQLGSPACTTFNGDILVDADGGTLRVGGIPGQLTPGSVLSGMTAANTLTVKRGGNFIIEDNANGSVASVPNRFGTPGNRPAVKLDGGTLTLDGPNVANTVPQTFGSLTLVAGPSTVNAVRAAGTPELVFSNLSPAKGSHVNFTGTTLGTSLNASHIRFETAPVVAGGGGAAGSTTLSLMPGARSGNDFVTYDGTYGVRVLAAAEYNQVAGNDVNLAGATENVKIINATPTTFPALSTNKAINSLVVNVNAALTWPMTNKLTLTSGQLISGIQNNSMNFSVGSLTAGSGSDASLDVSVFLNTTYIRGPIENNGSGKVTLVKNGAGTLQLDGSFDSTYSGGTFLNEGTITLGGTANKRYLGTGPVRIDNGTLNLGQVGATANAAGDDYTAVNAGQVGVASAVAYSISDTFNIGAGSVISGAATTGTGLNSLDRGIGVVGGMPNIVLAADAVVAHGTALSAPLDLGLGTIKNLGTNADLYYGLALNQDPLAGAITIGKSTAFKGVSTDRTNRRWSAGTINVTPGTSDIYLQGLQFPGSNPGYLYLGNGLAAGAPVLAAPGPLNANVLGNLIMDDSTAVYGDTSAGKKVTFAVKAGASLYLNQPNSMGSGAGVADIRVEDGGTLSTQNSNPSGINGAVTVASGGRLQANSTGGLTGSGTVTFNSGSVLDIAVTTGFRGSQATAIAAALPPGQLVRLSVGSFGSPLETLDSYLGSKAPIYELYAADRAAANPLTVGTTIMTLNKDAATGAGGMLVNDYSSRSLTSAADGLLAIGANGGTIAATSNTILYVTQPMALGANALTIGATNVLDRVPGPKLGTVQFNSALGLNTALPGSSITVIPGATLNNSANTIPDAADLTVYGTLLVGGAETVGSLAGTGQVNLQTYSLTVGRNNNNSTFSGMLTNAAVGGALFTKAGTGRLDIASRQNFYTGPFTISDGILALSGDGAVTNAGVTSYTLFGNGTLLLDNSAVNNRDRLVGVPPPVAFNGGTFRFVGKSGEASGESLGMATFSSGAATIDVVNGLGAGSSVDVAFDAAVPVAGTVNFTASNGTLGSAGDNPRVFFGGLSAGLLSFATVGGVPAYYDTATGVRAYTLAEGTEFDGTADQTALDTKYTTLNNHLALNAARTVNSLWIDTPGAGTVVNLGSTGGNTLSLTSGRLTLTGANDFALKRSGASSGTLTRTNNGTLFLGVDSGRTLTVSVPIANGTGQVEKDGAGTLILSATNTFTGALTINAGTVRYATGYTNDLNANAVNLWNAGVLDFAGDTDTLGALTIYSGGLTNSAAAGRLTVASLTMGGGPAGSSTYVSTGTGTNTLSGNVTYSALNDPDKAIIAGNLDLSSATRTFTVNNSVAPGAAVDLEVSAVISGAAGSGVTKNGTGVLKLSGANTFDGNLYIPDNYGSVILGHPQSLGTPTFGRTITIGNGDSLLLDATNGNVVFSANYTNLFLNGGGDSLVGVIRGALMNQSGNHMIPCPVFLNGGTYIASLQAGGKLTLSGSINGIQDLSVFGVGDTELGGAIVTGAKALTKYGTGTLTLSGNGSNTFSNTTTVNAGKLVLAKTNGVSAVNAIANGAITVNNGALLQYAVTCTNNPDMVGNASAVTLNGTGQLDFNGANDTIGAVTVTASGAMSDTTNLLNTAGVGNLAVNGLTITPVPGYITRIDAGAAGTLTLSNNITFTSAASGRALIGGANLSLGGTTRTLTINAGIHTNYDLAIDAAISGGAAGAGITKAGTGALRLNGANTFDGVLSVGNTLGTVILGNGQALGTPSVARTNSIGTTDTLALDGVGILDPNNRITLSLNGTGDTRFGLVSGALVSLAGSNTVPCAVVLAGTTQIASLQAGGKLTLSGPFSGAYALTFAGPGETALAGTNGTIPSATGITVLSNGVFTLENTVLANNANRLGDTLPVTLAGGTFRFSNGGGATNYSESLGALLVSAGSNAVFAAQASALQTSALIFASLARTGGTVNFIGEGLGVNAQNRIFITGQANGMIGPWATINGTNLAFYSSVNGVYAGTVTETGVAARGNDPAAVIPNNETVSAVINQAGVSGPITLEALWTNRVLEVRQETAYASIVAMSNSVANKTLQTSRLVIKEGQASLTIGEVENYRGTLTALTAGNAVALENQNAAALLTVNADVANSSAASGLSKFGLGPVLLTGSNSYSGATLLGEGRLEFGSSKAQKLSGVISGAGTLVKSGTNLLQLAGTNTYTGPTYINAGIVRPDLNSTFGTTAGGVFIASGATLDLGCDSTVGGTRTADSLDFGAEEFTVAGAGVNGAGAIVNNSGQNQGAAMHRVYLSDDTTFGGTKRWDLHSTSFLVMNDHTLTKTGGVEVVLQNTPVYPGTGRMIVNQGILRFEAATFMNGSASNSVTVNAGGVLDLWNLTPYIPTWSLKLNDRSIFRGSSNGATYGTNINIWAGPVQLNGLAFFNGGANYANWICMGDISGVGSLVRDGTSTSMLWLMSTNNTYSGGTIISNGILYAKYPGALPGYNDGRLTVAGGGTLAVHASDGTFGFTAENVRDLNAGASFLANNAVFSIDTSFSNLGCPYNLPRRMGLTKQGTNSLTLSGNAVFGNVMVNDGALNLSGNNIVSGNVAVVYGKANLSGTNTLIGGSAEIYAGSSTFTNGTLTLASGASLTCASNFRISTANGSGAFYLDGGSFSNSQAVSDYNFVVARETNSYGYFRMTSGNVTAGRFQMAGNVDNTSRARGLSRISGGALSFSEHVLLGRNVGCESVLTLDGGTITHTAGNELSLARQGGRSEINICGGIFNNSNMNTMFQPTAYVASPGYGTGTGIVNLCAGSLITAPLQNPNAAPAYLNFSGGTLASSGDSTTFVPGNMSGVYSFGAFSTFMGGAVIDSNGRAIAIPAVIRNPTGQGVSAISLANQGLGYIGEPYVSIEGGNGTGATAVANLVDDGTGRGTFKVGRVSITCPGVGYVSTPTVLFKGGGFNIVTALVGTVTLANNSGGGLTKIGTGTLTLSAANTYTGATTIAAGTLKLGTAAALLPNSPITLAGGTLDLNGYTITNAISGSGTVSNGTFLTTLSPNGPGVLGTNTLTLGNATVVKGVYEADVTADGRCDRINVQGNIDLSNLDLQIVDPSALDRSKVYTILSCTGTRTGTFKSTNLPDSRWHVLYRSDGSVQLLFAGGTLIRLR